MIAEPMSPAWAAMWAALAIYFGLMPTVESCERLATVVSQRRRHLPRIGIEATISSLSAYMRNGGTLVGAFEEQSGRRFATRKINYERARAMLEGRKLRQENDKQVRAVAYALAVSCKLSSLLGCEASRCLDAVGAAHRRMARLAQAKDAAFAMPKATMKLLTALPLLTLAFGSLLGARPLAFLLKPGIGTLCLIFGGVSYALGLLWMRALLKELDEKVGE
ncbi:pilus assembly protein [Bombiscardovia apis]|uniref:Pilus assembly protein n=1 Tax=Bombiscardovia apis TaxID=2932182 RepID=A0ABM8BEI6_9BIFI|nr:pilus assembly protein [Bombiscardovia apis]BDR55351.1 pilus assembly protein [Bombiscardovia apis]